MTGMTNWKEALPLGIADNTREAYAANLKKYEAWSITKGIEPVLPAEPENLATYIEDMIKKGLSSSTVYLTIYAIQKVHEMNGWQSIKDIFCVKQARKEAHRTKHAPQQAVPIRKDDMKRLVKVFRKDKRERYVQALTMALLMRACMLRRSEVIALTRGDYNPHEKTITIKRSKTDQLGQGKVMFVPLQVRNALARWMEMSGGTDAMPLFRSFKPSHPHATILDTKPSRTLVDKHLKMIVDEAGIKKVISSHSFRIGMAMDLADEGYSVLDLQQAGRWANPNMPAYYCRNRDARNGALADYHGEKDGTDVQG